MRILVTNDDGVDSPGIHALAAALVADGHDVVVVAPTDDRSGAGASIGRMMGVGPPPVEQRVWDELPDLPVHAIDAPPAMAVFADVPRRVRRPARPHRVRDQPGCEHRAPGAPLGNRGRHPHRGRLRHPRRGGVDRLEHRGRVPLGRRGPHGRRRGRVGGQARRRRPRPQRQRAQPRRSRSSRACARRSSHPPARSGWRRPTCRRATSRSRSPVAPIRLRAPTSRSSHDGYVSVTPLMSIVRGPARRCRRRHRRRARLSDAPGSRGENSAR